MVFNRSIMKFSLEAGGCFLYLTISAQSRQSFTAFRSYQRDTFGTFGTL